MENNLNANVAFVISKNYIGQFKVTFNSLYYTNSEINFSIHLFHGDLDLEDIEDIKRFINERNAQIKFYKISDDAFEGLPKMQGDNSYSAYYKTLLPYYLNNLGKVLFLDCDIIVRNSVKSLFEKESEYFLSCVPDYKINKKRKEHIKTIIDGEGVYFNSGVMLFDFSHSDVIVPKENLLEYISENKDKIRWHDQDILNHFYSKNCFFLNESYNYLTTYKNLSDLIFQRGKNKAKIVHYANWKPWRSNYIGKCYNLYKKNYKILKGEKGVNFLKKRNIFAQLKLIFSYIFR